MNGIDGYDQWKTSPPNDVPLGKCDCGHDWEDHFEVIQKRDDEESIIEPCTVKKCPCVNFMAQDGKPEWA